MNLGFPEIKPMAIGIWGGKGKPSDVDKYLRFFVKDVDAVTKTGIIINDYRLDVKIRSFLCDSPARSFLKGLYFDLTNLFSLQFAN